MPNREKSKTSWARIPLLLTFFIWALVGKT
jgi:hypothetical protein